RDDIETKMAVTSVRPVARISGTSSDGVPASAGMVSILIPTCRSRQYDGAWRRSPVLRIPFYYDYACPWAFLGSTRVEAYLKDLDVEVDFRPVELAALREPDGGKAPEPGSRKYRNLIDDLRHWCELVGIELLPEAVKLVGRSTRLALKAASVARDAGRFSAFHHPAYRARWSEARDLSDPEVVRDLLAGAGLDAAAALARAESAELAARLAP